MKSSSLGLWIQHASGIFGQYGLMAYSDKSNPNTGILLVALQPMPREDSSERVGSAVYDGQLSKPDQRYRYSVSRVRWRSVSRK